MTRAPRIVMTSFGFKEPGGGTLVPRTLAAELVRRGWDVTVFYAGTKGGDPGVAYDVVESEEHGIRLVGVFNRDHGLWDLGNPRREIDDPPITAAFAEVLDRVRPDVVHFHNLHNLGAALLDEAARRGIRSFFTAHNLWLVDPRGYLLSAQGELSAGPGRGGLTMPDEDPAGYEYRLRELRGRVSRSVTSILAPSESVARTLTAAGYPEAAIEVLPQAMPAAGAVWEALGHDRAPGRTAPDGPLTIGFFGSVWPIKGVHLLVHAAQIADADVRIEIHGDIGEDVFRRNLEDLDTRGIVTFHGAFGHDELPERLARVDVAALPSIVWETQGLLAAECLAGRVPVLVADMGGLGEQIRDGVDGLRVAGRDYDALAAAIERLANEPGLLERLQGGIEAPATFASHVDALEARYRGAAASALVAPSTLPPAVRWVGEHDRFTSLSIINQEVVGRLLAEGDVRVQRVERSGMTNDPALPHLADVEVRHMWPPDFSPAPGGRLALIQPWEFGAMPVDWVGPIRENVDEVWVPSEFVRRMYVDSGIDADRVHVVPNGVDLERLTPDGPTLDLDAPGTRLLFVGGLIRRKGPDVLLAAYQAAFAGRDDVTLVIKDFGAAGVYAGTDRESLRAYAAAGTLPRIVLLEDELSGEEMAALYRSCDVLVHPYRGEGFAMPVLEAMACGLPVIVTGGGPTDEFCPPEAGWRIRSERVPLPEGRVDQWICARPPWMLEPDPDHLLALMLQAVADPDGRVRRGAVAAAAAQALSWDAVAAEYRARIVALAAKPPRAHQPAPDAVLELESEAAVRVLATPAWGAADDRLGDLLAAWVDAAPAGTDACLHLLADSRTDGTIDDLADRVMAAASAAGVDLDAAADIDLLVRPLAAGDDDRLLHAAVDAYVPLHDACAGHVRLARAAGSAVVDVPDLAAFVAGVSAVR